MAGEKLSEFGDGVAQTRHPRLVQPRRPVHIEAAIDLDLNRLSLAVGLAIFPRDESAGIGVVPVDAEPAIPEEAGDGVSHIPIKRGAKPVAADDVGKPVVQPVKGRHRMHVDQQHLAKARHGLIHH